MEDPGSGHGTDAEGRARPRRTPTRPVPIWAVLRPVVITVGLVLVYYLLPLDRGFTDEAAAGLGVGLLAVLVLLVWQIRAITRSPYPRLRAVEALSATLSLFLLLFATTYHLLERAEPGSFTEPLTRTDSLYFTLTVFSTVGFGDITARSQPARIIVMTQMTGGILLVGVAARVVVGAVQGALHRREDADASPSPGRRKSPKDRR